MEKVKIFIADDHPIVREGIKTFFSYLPDYIVVGEAEDGSKVFEKIADLKPDVVIMDITMPHLDGIQVTSRVTDEFPETKVIILSMHHDRDHAIKAFRAGAMAYVVKGASLKEILMAVERVLAGKMYASSSVADDLLCDFIDIIKRDHTIEFFDTLSQREKEVLKLVADSATNKEIADKLCIAVSTVKSHRNTIMRKLNVNNIASLVKIAIRKGLVIPDCPPL